MTDGIGTGRGGATTGEGARARPGARMRGHVKLGERMWGRIRREYAAGASAGWLSARYGAGERTIGARAKKEGWRRKDLAEAADAELEAAEARGEMGPAPAIGAVWDAAAARAEAAALATAAAEVTDETRAGAAREALDRAVACMRRGDAAAATAYARLAGALEALARTGAGEDAGDPTGPGREAALAFLRREGAID